MRRIRSVPVALVAAGLISGVVPQAPAQAATPLYAMITVTINARAGVRPTFTVSAQAPAWKCVEGTWGSGTYVVECTPPPAPDGFENYCAWNVLAVTSAGIPGAGNLYGHTHCDTNAGSSASTPTGASSGDADLVNVPVSTFYCRGFGGAVEPALRPWTITCTANH